MPENIFVSHEVVLVNHTLRKINKISVVDWFLYLTFFLVYELSATIYDLPNSDILRWVVCFLLIGRDLFISCSRYKGKYNLLPSEYVFLLFPLIIQSFWNPSMISTTLSRSLSFIIYSMAIYSFFRRPGITSERILRTFNLFCGVMVFVVLPLNILSINRVSFHGDYVGIYDNRNMTVSVLGSIYTILCFCLVKSKRKVLLLTVTGVTVYLIFLTHSRVAIVIAIVVTAFVYIIYSAKTDFKRSIRVLLFILFALVFIPFLGERFNIVSINRVLGSYTGVAETGLMRTSLWKLGLELFKQKPLFGWGNNVVYYNTFVLKIPGWGVHNSYLIMLIEGGIAGFLCYMGFFISAFRKCWSDYKICKKMSGEQKIRDLVMFCAAMCLILFINGFSESFLFSAGNLMALPFWFCYMGCRMYLQKKKIELREQGMVIA